MAISCTTLIMFDPLLFEDVNISDTCKEQTQHSRLSIAMPFVNTAASSTGRVRAAKRDATGSSAGSVLHTSSYNHSADRIRQFASTLLQGTSWSDQHHAIGVESWIN
uniref:Uncharacterized protein n=1 Tax=Heterorhabditis bacteriophora TaxID=37862 RepID=A0A1I7XPZ5_HETBA